MSKFIGLREAAERTGLSVSTLRRAVRAHRLPAFRAGSDAGKILFNSKILDAYIEQMMLANLGGFFDDDDDEEELTKAKTVPMNLFGNLNDDFD